MPKDTHQNLHEIANHIAENSFSYTAFSLNGLGVSAFRFQNMISHGEVRNSSRSTPLIEAPSFHIRARDFLLHFYLFIPRIRFRWRERRRVRELRKAIASLRKVYKGVEELGLKNIKNIHNVALYVLLLELDWAILNWDMMHATDHWRRTFVARQMAVFLFEASEDLTQLLGRDYREALHSMNVGHETIDELGRISSQLNQFRHEHEKTLKRIRQFIGAHRDHDAGAQLDILDNLEPLSIYGLAGEFYVPLRALADFQVRLTLIAGNLKILLDQFLNKTKPNKK